MEKEQRYRISRGIRVKVLEHLIPSNHDAITVRVKDEPTATNRDARSHTCK